MNKIINLILSFLIIIVYNYSVTGQRLTEICERNKKIVCFNAFSYNLVLALFCTIDGQTRVVRVTLKDVDKTKKEQQTVKFDDFWPKPDSGNIELWDQWFKKADGKNFTEITNFISAFQLDLPQYEYPIVFTVLDRNYPEAKYLIGCWINYDSDVRLMKSVHTFFIDPYRATASEDIINLRSLYQYFPNEQQHRVTPIVALPEISVWFRRLFVYYLEENPKNSGQKSYRIHVFNQSAITDQWLFNEDCDCVELDPNIVVLSSTIIYHFLPRVIDPLNIADINAFFMLELYDNGEYGLKRVIVDYRSDQINKQSILDVIKRGNIRDLLCLPYVGEEFTIPLITTTTEREPPFLSDFTLPAADVSAAAQQSKDSSKSKSSKWWIILVIILVLIVIAAVIALLIYTSKKRSQAQKSSDTESSDSDDHISPQTSDDKNTKDSVENDL